jgi:uncharacterized protein YajQ (UPF0234 family)
VADKLICDSRSLLGVERIWRTGGGGAVLPRVALLLAILLVAIANVSWRGQYSHDLLNRPRLARPTAPRYPAPVPKTESFDVTTGVDLQEVDNAVNQAKKEVTQRYDFKGQKAEIEYDRAHATIRISAADEFYLNALWNVLRERMISRKVPVKNLHRDKVEPAAGGTVRQQIALKQGISPETARSIVKLIKEQKLKKIQSQIQGDAVRVSGPSRDELQSVITLLRQQDYDVELKFGNYR